jgi:hypothetical protein
MHPIGGQVNRVYLGEAAAAAAASFSIGQASISQQNLYFSVGICSDAYPHLC